MTRQFRCSPRYCEVDAQVIMPLAFAGKATHAEETKPGYLPWQGEPVANAAELLRRAGSVKDLHWQNSVACGGILVLCWSLALLREGEKRLGRGVYA